MTTLVNRLRQLLFPKAVLNNGSQLRDHLANERTFLSWTRMGLAFAAMALALGRLGMIDHVFSTTQLRLQLGDRSVDKLPSKDKPMPKSTPDQATRSEHAIVPNISGSDILASQLCWGISLGSFGYGILRYVSVRRTLIQGRFVPAIWGPVLMTTCSLGSLATLLYSGNEFHPQRHEARV